MAAALRSHIYGKLLFKNEYDFAKKEYISDVKISSDGKYPAYLITEERIRWTIIGLYAIEEVWHI